MAVFQNNIEKEHTDQVRKLSIGQQLQLAARHCGGTLEAQLAGAAIATVVARMVELDENDKRDLWACVTDLSTVERQEDAQETLKTILEILDPRQFPVEPVSKVEPTPPREGFEGWLVVVSQRLREARESAGITQEQLAQKTGLPQSHLSRLEGGKHSPSRKTLQRIADALGVDVKRFTLET